MPKHTLRRADVRPFVMDLGSAQVAVELAPKDVMGTKLGLAEMNKYRILLRDGLDGQAYAPTLWHELLHWVDWLYLASRLDSRKGHRIIDQLANAIHMILERNPEVWAALYARGRK